MNVLKHPGAKTPSELIAGCAAGWRQTILDAERSVKWWQMMAQKYPECPSFLGRIDNAKQRVESIKLRAQDEVACLLNEFIHLGLLPDGSATTNPLNG